MSNPTSCSKHQALPFKDFPGDLFVKDEDLQKQPISHEH